MIDFSELALSPDESRAARNFLGMSQAQLAEASGLPAHKLKRFETGNYVPDTRFLEDLRAFLEGQGYRFHDDRAPGAKAKAKGDLVPAGIVGATGSSPSENQGKPGLVGPVNLQFLRIAPSLTSDQVDRALQAIEDNESAIADELDMVLERVQIFFSDGGITSEGKTAFASVIRRMAENGLIFARLLGRNIVDVPEGESTKLADQAKTLRDLVGAALADLQRATFDGDKAADKRRKGRQAPKEVLAALIG